MPFTNGLEWTFNTQAERYEKMRPGYVPELYDDIFQLAAIDEASMYWKSVSEVDRQPCPS